MEEALCWVRLKSSSNNVFVRGIFVPGSVDYNLAFCMRGLHLAPFLLLSFKVDASYRILSGGDCIS